MGSTGGGKNTFHCFHCSETCSLIDKTTLWSHSEEQNTTQHVQEP